MSDTDEDLTPVDQPKVVVVGHGPNLCYGVCVEANGVKHWSKDGKPLALCACGLSDTKPFCDGSHKLFKETPTK